MGAIVTEISFFFLSQKREVFYIGSVKENPWGLCLYRLSLIVYIIFRYDPDIVALTGGAEGK